MNRIADSLKRTTWNHFSGNQLTFGPGAIGTLTGVVQREQARRVLIISDQQLVDAGLASQAEIAIQASSATSQVFGEGEAEPSILTVKHLLCAAQDYKPDLFVAVGGGSIMDLAKAAAVALAHDGDVEDLFACDHVPRRNIRLVCVPTTAGTGSEVSHAAMIKNHFAGVKSVMLSQNLRPDIAIVDPQMMLSCPPQVAAESGMVALTHAIEAYLVRNFYSFPEDLEHGLPFEGNHPVGDMYAEKAIRLIGRNLQRVVDDPEDFAAQSGMAFAATLAGIAFSSCGASLTQAIQNALSCTCQTRDGVGSGIVLPAVMQFWAETRQSRLAQIAGFLELDGTGQTQESEMALSAIQWVREVQDHIGLPTGLTAAGVNPEDVAALAATAVSSQNLIDLSPLTATVDDLIRILKTCF